MESKVRKLCITVKGLNKRRLKVPRKDEANAHTKLFACIGGKKHANKVHYGRCGNRECCWFYFVLQPHHLSLSLIDREEYVKSCVNSIVRRPDKVKSVAWWSNHCFGERWWGCTIALRARLSRFSPPIPPLHSSLPPYSPLLFNATALSLQLGQIAKVM